MKDLIQLKSSSSELSVSNSTMLPFMLGKVNSSLVELLFQVPVSILPLLLHAGIHHSTRQPLQNHILLRYTLFLYCQQTLIFVSRLFPIHPILVIHSPLNLVHLLIMASTSMMVLLVIVILSFATFVTRGVNLYLLYYINIKNTFIFKK